MKMILDPPLIAKREGWVVGTGWDRLDYNGTSIVDGYTFHKDEEFLNLHDIKLTKTTNVLLDMKLFGYEFRVMSPTTLYVRAF
jgi:hypothetical protein